MQDTRNHYLPNLDPLRFFAAAIVSFYHTDMILVANHYKKEYYYFFPFQHGDIAVVFFFVLSGFLITLLLLKEKQSGDISVKKFYLKRIFRIWPLYFLMLVLVFGYLNYCNYFHIAGDGNTFNIQNHLIWNIVFLVLISPNLALLNVNSLVYGNPMWSIGVEEQFYLIWPWIMKSKNSMACILYIILGVFLLSSGLTGRVLQVLVSHHIVPAGTIIYNALFYVDKLFTFGYALKIDAMAIGAVGAYLVFNKSLWLNAIYQKKVQVFLYLLLLILLVFAHLVAYQFYALVFIFIIINLANNPGTIFNIKSKALNYLGKISYGIYMFHLIAIVPVIKLVANVLRVPINFYSELLICFISLGATIIIAMVSFNTIEKFFLRVKARVLKAS